VLFIVQVCQWLLDGGHRKSYAAGWTPCSEQAVTGWLCGYLQGAVHRAVCVDQAVDAGDGEVSDREVTDGRSQVPFRSQLLARGPFQPRSSDLIIHRSLDLLGY
jgi:hypothetical protein